MAEFARGPEKSHGSGYRRRTRPTRAASRIPLSENGILGAHRRHRYRGVHRSLKPAGYRPLKPVFPSNRTTFDEDWFIRGDLWAWRLSCESSEREHMLFRPGRSRVGT
jgi:hypothetical protein